jgi:hypothetical protein
MFYNIQVLYITLHMSVIQRVVHDTSLWLYTLTALNHGHHPRHLLGGDCGWYYPNTKPGEHRFEHWNGNAYCRTPRPQETLAEESMPRRHCNIMINNYLHSIE